MHLLLIFTKNWFKQLNGYICFPAWKSQQYNMETILCGMLEELEFPNRLYIKLIRIYMTKTENVRLRLPFLEKRPKMPVKGVRNI
jgi:hypothetical protein